MNESSLIVFFYLPKLSVQKDKLMTMKKIKQIHLVSLLTASFIGYFIEVVN